MKTENDPKTKIANIILYGNANVGKTTTLMKLAIMLIGGGSVTPWATDAINSVFRPKGRYKDAHLIIEYKGRLICLSTDGDTWSIGRENTDIFSGVYSNYLLYHVKDNEIVSLTYEDKKRYREIPPAICICACRPNGDGYGAIKVLHAYSETRLMEYRKQLWIRKDKEQDSDAVAKNLLDLIDECLKEFNLSE